MQHLLELKNISKIFGQEKVLENISLNVDKGEMIAVVGKSGSGKTTILNILGLISSPSSGEYRIDNKTVKNINSKTAMLLRRNYIGYLFQNYGLVEDETVEWNLKLAYAYKNVKKKEQKEQITKFLYEFNLSGKGKKKIFQLSGGEQQRVALIRLIIKDCKIILADEPTGSLDEGNRDMVMDRLAELNKRGKTIIVVTHDMEVAAMCRRIIDLGDIKR